MEAIKFGGGGGNYVQTKKKKNMISSICPQGKSQTKRLHAQQKGFYIASSESSRHKPTSWMGDGNQSQKSY